MEKKLYRVTDTIVYHVPAVSESHALSLVRETEDRNKWIATVIDPQAEEITSDQP